MYALIREELPRDDLDAILDAPDPAVAAAEASILTEIGGL